MSKELREQPPSLQAQISALRQEITALRQQAHADHALIEQICAFVGLPGSQLHPARDYSEVTIEPPGSIHYVVDPQEGERR